MSKTSNRKPLATMYALGLIWIVALVGGAVVLTQPMLAIYESVGIESAAVQFVATAALVLLLATPITVAVGFVMRSTPDRAEVQNRR